MLDPSCQRRVGQAIQNQILAVLIARFGQIPDAIVSALALLRQERKRLKFLFHHASVCADLDAFLDALRSGPSPRLQGRRDLLDAEFGFRQTLQSSTHETDWRVYADWLDENGQATEADWIRTVVALADGAIPSAKLPEVVSNLQRMQAVVESGWLRQCAHLRGRRPLLFRITQVETGPRLTLLQGVLQAGSVRPLSAVEVPFSSGEGLHTWVRDVRHQNKSIPPVWAGLAPLEVQLVIAGHHPSIQPDGLVTFTPQADAELERRLNLSLDEIPFSVRGRNVIRRRQWKTVRDLASHTAVEILEGTAFGETSLREIQDRLASLELEIGIARYGRQGETHALSE